MSFILQFNLGVIRVDNTFSKYWFGKMELIIID